MMEGFGSPPSTPTEASLSRSGLDPSSLDPESILSPDEIQLLHRRFAAFNPNANKTRSLAAAHAIRLFRDDFPTLSEWEIQELFTRCDLNNDGQLAQHEYVHARAYHRVLVEAAREDDVVRSFTILDTDSDGVIHANEVLHLVEQARQPSARLLKQAILQSAVATKQSSHPSHRASRNHEEDDITCDHFVTTIRDVNRGIEREIAAKTVRMLSLEDKLRHHLETLQGVASGFDRAALVAKIESVQTEIDVLKKEIARAKREFVVTDSNSALTKICETLVATYENEQHVYECLTNFITYCGLRDPVLFRQRLEAAGRQVNVLDSILMAPTHHVQATTEYALLTDLTLRYHNCRDVHTPSAHRIHERQISGFASDASRHARLLTNSTLRRHFAYYTMAGSITNLETMTRSNFAKFVKDCTLHTLVSPPLTDPDIDNIYATATRGTNPQEQHHRRERAHMAFAQWLVACELLLQRLEPNVRLDPDTLKALIKVHVIARAKVITTQNLAPDVSQIHVLKLLREFLWLFKQIFAHFAGHSLIEVDTSIVLSMSRFLRFARAFEIIRASSERDGEPYTPPPLSESTIIQPISQMELLREFYAAKLDISFANPARRDAVNMNFREFLRCIQRIALAMHAHNPRKRPPANGILSTSFMAVKEDDTRGGQRTQTPLYHRRGNLFKNTSPTKECKMTSTSIISRLLLTSRAIVSTKELDTEEEDREKQRQSSISSSPTSPFRPRSPTRIFYGAPVSPTGSNKNHPVSPRRSTVVQSSSSPLASPQPSPRPSPRSQPVVCGGPSVVRVLRQPAGS